GGGRRRQLLVRTEGPESLEGGVEPVLCCPELFVRRGTFTVPGEGNVRRGGRGVWEERVACRGPHLCAQGREGRLHVPARRPRLHGACKRNRPCRRQQARDLGSYPIPRPG